MDLMPYFTFESKKNITTLHELLQEKEVDTFNLEYVGLTPL